MTPRQRRLLWGVIAVGTIARIVLAFTTHGVSFDIASYRLVGDALRHDPLHVYGRVNGGFILGGAGAYHWPYPPGFFPWILVTRELAVHTFLPFDGVIKLPAIAADAGLAWLVQDVLGHRGANATTRLVAAGLVALGPSFIAVSGYHGQIDSVAILPAAVGVALWPRESVPQRALTCGLLIGLGATIKTVPLVMVLALLPTVRGWREAATLVAAAIALPLLALSPFLASDSHQVTHALRYGGAPGLGGLSLVVQPGLAANWLNNTPLHLTSASHTLYDHGTVLTGVALLAMAAVLIRRRIEPFSAAAILWVTAYVFSANFFVQYLVWGLPFFLMARHLGFVAVVQAAMLVPTVLAYGAPWKGHGVGVVYAVLLIGLWVGWTAWLFLLGRSALRTREPGLAVASG